ncbi:MULTISPECIES: motility protein A [Microterricola]|uniref:Chemotaxis protein MotA n=2 Tax=Microterricola TaxID=518733 RepID=A0A1H1W2Y3_9MICO|nr:MULTISPECIES: MotA/TolQ/ExbB proton channel family protein [Microterricola]PPL15210.1 motility protein A [Microterricola pindariensis]SDS91415.1 chemotaxis protein MotA [Microterricola viridarii]
MDIAIILGLVIAFGSLFAMMTLEGTAVTAVLLPAPMILVLGASMAVGMAGGTLRDTIAAFKALPSAFIGRSTKPDETIGKLVSLAEIARSEGLLALEIKAEEEPDQFLKRALQSVADGTDGEELRILLEDEISTSDRAARNAARYFTSVGGYAPTIGIIGTVVSLIHVLEKLDSPATLGPMIATAFVATLWGLLSANFIFLPIGTRLKRLAELEVERMTLLMEGVLAIHAGSQPRLLGDRLRAMVPREKAPREKEQPVKVSDAA